MHSVLVSTKQQCAVVKRLIYSRHPFALMLQGYFTLKDHLDIYTAKATDAVKLFGPRLRRRKPYRFQTWPEDRGYTVSSNDAIICDCMNWRFCASFDSYPYVYIAPKWSLFANSVTYYMHVYTYKYDFTRTCSVFTLDTHAPL